MPDLHELCAAAVEAATGDEAVEAYAEESRHTEASALRGEIEGLTFAESRGVGVRLIAGGRLGYAYAADPTPDEVRDAVRRARENAALAEPDEFNLLPSPLPAEPIPALYREDQADIPTDRKVALALDLERRAISIDPRVTKIDAAQIGDAVSRVAIASTTGVQAEYARTDAWCVAVSLAVEGDETQTGFSFTIGRGHRRAGLGGDRRRGGAARGAHAGCREAADREGPDRPRPVRRDVVPGRAGRRALGGGRAEAALAVRVDGRSAGGLGAVHARRRRHDHDRARGLAVRRRGRAHRPDRAVHARNAERLPAQHVHGGAHRWRNRFHRERETRRIQEHARRGDLELLPRRRGAVVRRAARQGRGRRADPGRERRALRSEPDQRRVLAWARRACGSPAVRWASRCAR